MCNFSAEATKTATDLLLTGGVSGSAVLTLILHKTRPVVWAEPYLRKRETRRRVYCQAGRKQHGVERQGFLGTLVVYLLGLAVYYLYGLGFLSGGMVVRQSRLPQS
jgi:hypothetical protein